MFDWFTRLFSSCVRIGIRSMNSIVHFFIIRKKVTGWDFNQTECHLISHFVIISHDWRFKCAPFGMCTYFIYLPETETVQVIERKEGRQEETKNQRNCESNCDRSFIWIVFSQFNRTYILYIVNELIFIKIDAHESIDCRCIYNICKWRVFFLSWTHRRIIWCATYAHIFYKNSLFYVFSLFTSHIMKVSCF